MERRLLRNDAVHLRAITVISRVSLPKYPLLWVLNLTWERLCYRRRRRLFASSRGLRTECNTPTVCIKVYNVRAGGAQTGIRLSVQCLSRMLSLRMVGLVSSRFCPRQHQLARAHREQGVISEDIRIMRKEQRIAPYKSDQQQQRTNERRRRSVNSCNSSIYIYIYIHTHIW